MSFILPSELPRGFNAYLVSASAFSVSVPSVMVISRLAPEVLLLTFANVGITLFLFSLELSAAAMVLRRSYLSAVVVLPS